MQLTLGLAFKMHINREGFVLISHTDYGACVLLDLRNIQHF